MLKSIILERIQLLNLLGFLINQSINHLSMTLKTTKFIQ